MEKLTLRVNEPAVCALKFTDGIPVDSQYGGEETMFSLVDGRRLFAPAALKEAIERAGVRKGQPIQIVKKGASRFDVAFVRGEVETGPSANSAPSRTTTNYKGTMQQQSHPNTGAAVPAPPIEWGPEIEQLPDTHVEASTVAARLMSAFAVAIDALVEIQQNANRRGLGITLTSDNLTSMGLSVYINECKKGGAR